MTKKILIHPNGKIPLLSESGDYVSKPRYIISYNVDLWILVSGFWNDNNFWVDSAFWIDEL